MGGNEKHYCVAWRFQRPFLYVSSSFFATRCNRGKETATVAGDGKGGGTGFFSLSRSKMRRQGNITSVSPISGEGKCSQAEYKNHAPSWPLSSLQKNLRTFARHRRSSIHQNICFTKDVAWMKSHVLPMILC